MAAQRAHSEDSTFRALADPVRREILSFVGSRELPTAGEIAAHFPDIGRTAVSSHLRILRDATLLAEVRDGQRRRYQLGPNRADAAIDFLRQIYAPDFEA